MERERYFTLHNILLNFHHFPCPTSCMLSKRISKAHANETHSFVCILLSADPNKEASSCTVFFPALVSYLVLISFQDGSVIERFVLTSSMGQCILQTVQEPRVWLNVIHCIQAFYVWVFVLEFVPWPAVSIYYHDNNISCK